MTSSGIRFISVDKIALMNSSSTIGSYIQVPNKDSDTEDLLKYPAIINPHLDIEKSVLNINPPLRLCIGVPSLLITQNSSSNKSEPGNNSNDNNNGGISTNDTLSSTTATAAATTTSNTTVNSRENRNFKESMVSQYFILFIPLID